MSVSGNVSGIERIFSVNLRKILCNVLVLSDRINEIRLRTGQPLVVIIDNDENFINAKGEIIDSFENAYIVSNNEIRETMEYISNYSLYAYEEEIKQGYITIAGGHRIGICGKAVIENNNVKTLRYISFINIRIAHEIIGCSDELVPMIYKDSENIYSTLIISPPGRGKTTLLRDLVRNISNGFRNIKESGSVKEYTRIKEYRGLNESGNIKEYRGLNVAIADERSEIAACYLGVPQNDVGIRTDVLDGVPKALGIMMLIRTMSPKVIAVDEIGSIDDINAIKHGINCGCRFICTVHGDDIEDVRNKPVLREMINDKVFQKYIIINKWGETKRYELI